MSTSIVLEAWRARNLLKIHASRRTAFGLEMHLVMMHKAVEEFDPRAVIVDPVSSFASAGQPDEVKSMLVRRFDYLKTTGTGFEETALGISSLIDSWFQVRGIEISGERTRGPIS